jgi:hypothetical protein
VLIIFVYNKEPAMPTKIRFNCTTGQFYDGKTEIRVEGIKDLTQVQSPKPDFKLSTGAKLAWTQALRSGEYEQGKGHLFEHGRYCCLGVLADCMGRMEGRNFLGPNGKNGAEDESDLLLVRDRAVLLPRGVQDLLACFNDGKRSFVEIADFIEKVL